MLVLYYVGFGAIFIAGEVVLGKWIKSLLMMAAHPLSASSHPRALIEKCVARTLNLDFYAR